MVIGTEVVPWLVAAEARAEVMIAEMQIGAQEIAAETEIERETGGGHAAETGTGGGGAHGHESEVHARGPRGVDPGLVDPDLHREEAGTDARGLVVILAANTAGGPIQAVAQEMDRGQGPSLALLRGVVEAKSRRPMRNLLIDLVMCGKSV